MGRPRLNPETLRVIRLKSEAVALPTKPRVP